MGGCGLFGAAFSTSGPLPFRSVFPAFDCFISQIVIDEVSADDPEEARRRMEIIDMFPVLEVTEEAELLAKAILDSGAIPPRAVRDAAHIAVAAIHNLDYLLTWNCTHLANAQVIRRVSVV